MIWVGIVLQLIAELPQILAIIKAITDALKHSRGASGMALELATHNALLRYTLGQSAGETKQELETLAKTHGVALPAA